MPRRGPLRVEPGGSTAFPRTAGSLHDTFAVLCRSALPTGLRSDPGKPPESKLDGGEGQITYAVGSMEWQAQMEKELAARKAAAEEKEKRRLARLAAFLGKNRKRSSRCLAITSVILPPLNQEFKSAPSSLESP